MARQVDLAFTTALPKAELHAHLSGSISANTLHQLWIRKQLAGRNVNLDDPLTVISPGGGHVDVITFFPLFDKYIYRLVSDAESVKFATKSVLQDFEADGVAYLELRTTPRENAETGLTKDIYVSTVNDVLAEWNRLHRANAHGNVAAPTLIARLILCVDRKMTSEEAHEVVDLAIRYKCTNVAPPTGDDHELDQAGFHQTLSQHKRMSVVGVDLCGNPMKGDVSTYTSAFRKARAHGLCLTVHFAEIPHSSTDDELAELLSWQPSRLGHAINLSSKYIDIIKKRKLSLELCLSCNVLAKLTSGGFAMHHFGDWHTTDCLVALSTDDVGIFGSSLSQEYLLAAQNFRLGVQDLVELSRSAARAAFDDNEKERILDLIADFEIKQSQDTSV